LRSRDKHWKTPAVRSSCTQEGVFNRNGCGLSCFEVSSYTCASCSSTDISFIPDAVEKYFDTANNLVIKCY
jgi:hypothetical protein